MRKNIETILLWGCLWGLEETTLGHFLHILPVNFGWMIWFPLAYAFMYAVYQKTSRINSILYASMIASALKLIDFFVADQIQKVVYPAVAILLEGLSVYAVYYVIEKRPQINRFQLGKAMTASMLQEFLFMGYAAGIALIVPAFKRMTGLLSYLTDIWHGLVIALIIFMFMKYFRVIWAKVKLPKIEFLSILHERKVVSVFLTAFPYLLLAVTVYAQWVM
jgi:hypothetical protein